MSAFRPARQGFASRKPLRSGHQLRADWVAAIMLAGTLATEVERPSDPADAGFGQNLTRLIVTMRELTPDNFPIAASSARTMAGAFLKLARDFAHPSWSPQARTACAPFLKAGAACLDGLLAGLRFEEAAVTRRMMGEREDER